MTSNHPTPQQAPDGDAELRKQIGDLISNCVGEYNSGGSLPSNESLAFVLDPIMAALQAHISEAVRLARIDELEHIEGDSLAYSMVGGRPTYLEERIKQLTKDQPHDR